MDVEIRPIREDEYEEFVAVVEAAFGEVVTPVDVANERRVAEVDRTLGAFDGGRMVGGASAYSLRLSVPGGEVATAGVTSVGVLPTHRRRGINTAFMRRILDDARERSEPLAALFASEGGIYGRFGFGLGSFSCGMDLEAGRSAFVRGYAPSGRVLLLPKEEAMPRILRVYAEVRRTRAGMPVLDERWLEYLLGHHHPKDDPSPFLAVHETDGVPDGYAVYRVKHAWPGSVPQTELEVSDLMATTPQAYADMWRFLLDADLVHRVTAWARPVDEPLLHLLAEPRRLHLTVKDALWVRPLDVPAALTGRRYATDGRLVVELRDPFCPWNEGRWALDVTAGVATCQPTEGEADLVCDVNAIGAVYLGGSTFRQLRRAGRVRELHPGALERADALVAWDPAPWCPFIF